MTGAAGGAAGAGLKKGIASLFAPSMAAPSAASAAGVAPEALGTLPPMDMSRMIGVTGITSPVTPSMPAFDMGRMTGVTGVTRAPGTPVPAPAPAMPTVGQVAGAAKQTGQRGGSRVGGLLRGAKENWEIVRDTGSALNAMFGQQTAETQAQAALEQRRLEYERAMEELRLKRQETEAERESRRRLTQILMPLLQQQFSNVLPPVTQTQPKAG